MELKTYEECRNNLRVHINLEIPFTPQELTDDILDLAIRDALDQMDKYHPKVATTTEYNGDGKDLIRSYISKYDISYEEPYIEELGYDLAEIHKVAKPWTLEEIYNDQSELKLFQTLCVAKAGMMMANVRRSATMSNLPFDIKGDQFFDENKNTYEATLTLLQNTVQSTY